MEIEPVLDQANPPPSLNTLLLEVRFKIIKNLLINPILEEFESILGHYHVRPQDNHGIKYYLHPAILRVCRQNYEDGCEILYSQTFFLCCNRHLISMDCKEIKETTQPAFQKVRGWIIVINSYTDGKRPRPE
ncbi:uncharacterized protein Bfra_004566 [Botrytis fragariae]|uniref:Uncharacterized protein n=1 Tax=Botrytis fragariae TaxID=1964551 RepID=A0A8H6AW74_9HELO|nr:uncharacterized protein Bfra_004566 [Botrytis fragariae]KAF5874555.1 hypothetical protein Bfra_004566 [Botrytis fragariae]